MSKPYIHAKSSAKRYGGKPEDYLDIHTFMDSSKGAISDNRHRALTHTSWFIMYILPRVFGETFKNSKGDVISTRDVAEQHILEDFGGKFIPTVQDYFQEMEFKPWMQNGKEGYPPSAQKFESVSKSAPKEVFPEFPPFPKMPEFPKFPDNVTYDGSFNPHTTKTNKFVD